MAIIKKFGEDGTLSNKIRFNRTEADGNWILEGNLTVTQIVRGVSQDEDI